MTSGIVKLMRGEGIAAVLVLLLSAAATAQSDADLLKTDWIDLVKGYKDADSGVEVREVVRNKEDGGMQVIVAVPKMRMGDGTDIEEVRVVGQRPEAIDPRQWLPELEYEWVDDYDNDHYGLLVRFTEEQKIPLRLFFSADAGYLQQ